MTATSQIFFEQGYQREVYLAVELLDAVTMTRVSSGVKVVAEGLRGKPIVNRSGCLVWLKEENAAVPKITVDPSPLPYETVEVEPADLDFPLTTIELQPRPDYQFAPGVTGLRGTVIERRVTPPVPVVDGEVRLQWLDGFMVPQDSPTLSRTDSKSGDFVSIIRLAPTDKPDVDDNGALTVRLQVRRGLQVRSSTDFKLAQGRVTDPTKPNPLTFAWDELQL